MFDILLALFLLLSPIILLPAIGNVTALQFYQFGVIDSRNTYLQLQFFQVGSIVLYLSSFFCKKQRVFKDNYLVLFILACIVSIFLHPISIKSFPNILLGFLLYKTVYEYSLDIKKILFPVFLVCMMNFTFAVIQSHGIGFIYNSTGRIDGLMKISTHLGVYQALSFPICLMLNPVLCVFPLISLYLAHSHTAFIAISAGLIYLFRKKILYIGSVSFLFIIALATILVVNNWNLMLGEFETRLWIWRETFYRLTFWGHGFVKFDILREGMGHYESPYNVYLSVLYALGVLSIPLFIWLANLIQKAFTKKDFATQMIFSSCIILLFAGLRMSIMDFPRIAGTAIVLFALLKTR